MEKNLVLDIVCAVRFFLCVFSRYEVFFVYFCFQPRTSGIFLLGDFPIDLCRSVPVLDFGLPLSFLHAQCVMRSSVP
jgi:hypothetical protein